MNVLIVLEHGRISGVNSFARALSLFLRNQGCKVYFNVIDKHTRYYNYVTEYGWGYYDGRVDIDICFHNYNTSFHRFAPKAKLNVFFTHGTQCDAYVPPFGKGLDSVFYLSGQQRDYYGVEKGSLFPNIIEQINFKPKKARKKLKKVLLCDVRFGDFYADKVKEACNYLDVQFDSVPRDSNIFNLRKKMNDYDVVIGYGRCIIEALSIGKCVIIYGMNGGDGYLRAEDYELVKYKNFSGYSKRTMFTPPRIEALDFYSELKKYNYIDGISLMDKVNNEHNLERINQILNERVTRSYKKI